MRYRALFAAVVLAACGTAPAPRTASDVQSASTDSVLEFLIASAASDFRTHNSSDPGRFRDVRFGHVATASGDVQYMLCGQFLAAQQGGKAEWMHFTTIKTSGYEQWIGAQAAGPCQSSSITWHKVGDLSSSLQSRLESLR